MHRATRQQRRSRLLALLTLEREEGVFDLLCEDGWLPPSALDADDRAHRLALLRRVLAHGFPVRDDPDAPPFRRTELHRLRPLLRAGALHPRAPPQFS